MKYMWKFEVYFIIFFATKRLLSLVFISFHRELTLNVFLCV